MTKTTRLLLSLCILCVSAPAALAQPDEGPPGDEVMPPGDDEAPPPDDRPWAEGVTDEEQVQALKLFREANDLLNDSLFVKAVERYRDALSHWDHPAIHYNLALALLNLDQPIQVYDTLQKAMEYGVAPLDEDKYERANSYFLLVQKQLATVDIRCDIPGAKVSMDGQTLFTAPGRHKAVVRIGEHNIVAQAPGYISTNETHTIGSAETLTLDVKMYTPEEMTRYKRRWKRWQPWAVVGGGAVVAAVGGILHLSAKSGFEDFDKGIEDCGGCVPDGSLADGKSSAETKQAIAMVTYALGGATIAAGLVLVYLNRPKSYRLDEENKSSVAITPLIGRDTQGISATFSF